MDPDLTLTTEPTRTAGPPWLQPWLAWVDRALHREILRLRTRYELSMDELRGLYVSDEQVDRLINKRAPSLDVAAEVAGLDVELRELLSRARAERSPLHHLAERFELDETDLVAVILCLAPEVELSYQTIYAYLNDDVTRRLPTVDLCHRLSGGPPLDTTSPAVAGGLVLVQRLESAPLWRSAGLVLSEPVRQLLVGTDPLLLEPGPDARPEAEPRARLVILEGSSDDAALQRAHRLCAYASERLVTLDPSEPDTEKRLRSGLLRARLHDATLYLTGEDLGVSGSAPLSERALARCSELTVTEARVLVSLRPGQADRLPIQGVDHQRLEVERPEAAARAGLWTDALGSAGVSADPADVATVAALFSLGAAEIRAAAASVARNGEPDLAGLTRAARERSTYGLDGVAERVRADYTWADLVLPPATLHRLAELEGAIRNRHQVFDAWSFGRLAGGHSSVRALFSGPSGTGKTMSASVVARQLGLELYRVELSSVVSKYVGETEKNLERVLSAAESSNALLLFDEADALFGKRTEVKDAHDRYANIETAFLLQRIETFDGVVILATNLAGNLDESFSRRIQFHIEFPMPDGAAREQLWRMALPASAPVDDDFDPVFLAGMFPMSGGEVRSASLIGAFMAAGEGVPIGMRHLVRALARQRRQQGKVPSSAEFRGYLQLVRDEEG